MRQHETIKRQAEVIAELRAALADLRSYATSSKYAAPLATMNPQDIVDRIRDWNMRITSVEMNGVDIVDDTLQGRAQVHADKYAAERGYKVHKVHDVCEAGYKVHFSQGGNTWDEAVFFSTT